ncbi:hypothetical protein D3C76_1370450 [compost metagenome]
MRGHAYLIVIEVFAIDEQSFAAVGAGSAGLSGINQNAVAYLKSTDFRAHLHNRTHAFMTDNRSLVCRNFAFDNV